MKHYVQQQTTTLRPVDNNGKCTRKYVYILYEYTHSNIMYISKVLDFVQGFILPNTCHETLYLD